MHAIGSKAQPLSPEPTMRQERTVQATIFEIFAGHEIGCELKAISQWLDRQRALVSLVAGDLRRHGLRETGRRGLPAETVLRCALLKQQRQLSYAELAFHLEDSASFRAFARLPLAWSPKKSVLHQTISAIRPETWEAVNRVVLASAKRDKLESGATVRIDSTVSAALMHEPRDSALLWDAVRVMTRLLRQAAALPGAPALQWRDRRRLAKQRARAIEYSRGKNNRRRLYRELIAATRATQAALQQAGEKLADLAGIAAERWRAQLGHYLPLIERILAQSQRRVTDVAFHKKRGLAVEDMVKSRWVYRKLRNFRAGIEAGISCLKRAYGLARCTWRGLDHFKTYIWSAVVAHNLVLARNGSFGEGFRMPARGDYPRAQGPASESPPGRNPRGAAWAQIQDCPTSGPSLRASCS